MGMQPSTMAHQHTSARVWALSPVAIRLGPIEFDQRLRRLLRFAPAGETEGDAIKALEQHDGHVGEAISTIGGIWFESDSSDAESSMDEDVVECGNGCGNPDCGRRIEETIDPGWWDERFEEDIQEDTNSEWLIDYQNFGHLLLPYLANQARTLVLGCGNSDFSLHLYRAGITNIVNIDISPV